MNLEVICVDDKYDELTKKVFAKNKIKYPKKNEICQVLRIHKYILQGGKIGLFLDGYDGQFIKDEISGDQNELSFNRNRFRNLDQTPILEKQLSNKVKNLV